MPMDLFGDELPRLRKKKRPQLYHLAPKPPVKRLGQGEWVPYDKNLPGAKELLPGSGVGKEFAEVFIHYKSGRAILLRRRAVVHRPRA